MKRIAILATLFLAISAQAQFHTPPLNRFVIVETFANSALAAAALSDSTMIHTTNPLAPWVNIRVVYADFPFVPVNPVIIHHKEFAQRDTATAASWFAYYGNPLVSSNAGIIQTSEKTIIVWWL